MNQNNTLIRNHGFAAECLAMNSRSSAKAAGETANSPWHLLIHIAGGNEHMRQQPEMVSIAIAVKFTRKSRAPHAWTPLP